MMDEVEETFRMELNLGISRFVEKNGRLPQNDEERYTIYKDAKKTTLLEYPPETISQGTLGPGPIPPTPPAPPAQPQQTQPNIPKGRWELKADGTKKWIPE